MKRGLKKALTVSAIFNQIFLLIIMKLHLNLTLRRAVLAAMSTMAVYTTQAETFPGGISNGQYLVTGTTSTSASYNDSSEDLFIGGGEGGNAALTMTGSASITANTVNVGNSHNDVYGKLTMETGTSATTNQLNVGAYNGLGILNIEKGAVVNVGDSLNVGYHTEQKSIIIDEESESSDTINVNGGKLTVGTTSHPGTITIGASKCSANLNLTEDSEVTFNGTTSIAQGSDAESFVSVEGTSKLTLNGDTALAIDTDSMAYVFVQENATVTVKDNMYVGVEGYGLLSLRDNSTLTAKNIVVASKEGSRAVVSFGGSEVGDTTTTVSADAIFVGAAGNGTATFKDATIKTNDIVLGDQATGMGTLYIEDGTTLTGITENTKTDIYVGRAGTGALDVSGDIDLGGLYVIGTKSSASIDHSTLTAEETVIIGGQLKTVEPTTTDDLTHEGGTLATGDLTIVNGGYLDIQGTATVEGSTLLDNSSSINVGGTLTTNSITEEDTKGNTVNGGTITIEEGGTWNADGSTTGLGTITNNGALNVGGSMTVLQGITGTGTTTVAKDSSLALAGATTQGAISNAGDITISAQTTAGAITNDGDITVSGAGRVDADSLGGTGTTTITIDASTVATSDGLAIVELDMEPTSAIKVDIDTANASALVGKGFDFVKVGDGLISVGQDNFSVDEGWTINWDDKTITTGDASKGLQITYTGDDSGMVFTKLGAVEAKQIEVELPANVTIELEVVTETVLTATVTPEQMGTTVIAPVTEEEKEAATDVVVENNTVIHAAEIATGVNEETHEDIRTNVVIGKDVESSGSGSTKVQSVVVNQKTTINNGTNTTEIKGNIGASGVALMLDGKTEHKGKGKAQGSELGFHEDIKEGSLLVYHEETDQTIKNEVKKIDIVQVGKDSDVSVSDMSMHSTHALTIGEGTTIEFNGVDLHVGGTTDVNLTQEVEVKVYNENGEWTGETKIETVDFGAHLTVDSTITKATVKISGESVVKFEKIDDDDHHSFGSTTFAESEVEIDDNSTLGDNQEHMQTIKFDEESKVTNRGNVKNAEFHKGSELKNNGGYVEDVVFEEGTKLHGTGHVKHIKMNGGRLSVGNSPGELKVSSAEFSNTAVDFYFITDSAEWKYDGSTGEDAASITTGSGCISQLNVDQLVTMNNATITILYETSDTQETDGYRDATEAEIAGMDNKFQDGASITLITGNLDQLSGTYHFIDSTLPTLEDGLFWDTTQLFTTGKIFVIGEKLEEPWRIANTLVSAGETVLGFGRLAETQGKLRKAGTTRTWGSAIAQFDSIDSGSSTNGYDYNAWGAAVGVDHAFTNNTVVGVAFGCTWGENEPENGTDFYDAGSIDQDAKMIGIYGVHKFRTKGLMNDVKLSAFAAYGWFENNSTRSSLKTPGTATAEWDSEAWVLSASLSRDITTDSGVVFTPYVGVEYTKAGMDDFTETGRVTTADYTADEDYSNLAVKLGVAVSKTYGKVTPYANIAFISDVDRSAAKVTATGRETITGKSALPGRNGFEIGVGATWQLSDNLDVNAGYSAEIRDKATEHNARVGIGYTF